MRALASRVLAPRAAGSAAAVLRRECACPGSSHDCDSCRKKEALRRKADHDDGLQSAPSIVHDVLRGPGRPLDEATRAFMEPRFGHDFGRVRVHADTDAAASARAVNARAYTVGHDVVFAAGLHAPHTPAGRTLLAHELAHVVQDGGRGTRPRPALVVGRESDPAEREADAMAEGALAGTPAPPPIGSPGGGAQLRRQVRNTVVTDFQKRAQACMVHVHGEEHTALAVGKEIRGRRCVNFMHLDTKKREVDFDFKESGFDFEGQADPNRIFTPAGRSGPAILETHPKPGQKDADKVPKKNVKTAAEQVLKEFAEQVFVPRLEECRKDERNPDASLPVMALHNNESLDPAGPKIAPVASKSRSPNPATGAPGDPNDFLLVTQAADFDAFKGTHNVILQQNPIQPKNDDGSLSVLLAGSRFVNVEKEGRSHAKPVGTTKGLQKQDDVYIKNYAMAGAVLDRFGVLTSPCGGSPKFESRTRSLFNRRLGQSGRQPTTAPTDKPMLARDELPDPPPKGCLLFKDQPALDRRADEWRERIENIPLLNLIHWALGGPDFVPPEPMAEFKAQQKCLIKAARGGLKAQGLGMPGGDVVLSGQRTFAKQQDIWSKKFAFTFPSEFDRISDFARKKCDPALGTDVKWNPKNKAHQDCWRKLSDDEKQKEILMASSAPGVSRHHAGVDFDIGQSDADLDPKAWTDTGGFADAYRWLARNASAFGFIQPFDTRGGYGTGYMSERWHWSYFPVAQAVLEFMMDHDQEVEGALQELWSDGQGGIKPEFSFVAKNWRDYVFNVEDVGVF